MGKVYFIYATIPLKIFEQRIKYLIDNNAIHRYQRTEENMYGLYAWTTSKKKMESFMDTRDNDIYVVKKKDIDKEKELKNLKREIGNLELDYYLYQTDNDGGEICITSTKDEFIACTEYTEENFWSFCIDGKIEKNYEHFNKELQIALDLLGYTYYYHMNVSDDKDMMEMASYNAGYGKTVLGYDKLLKKFDEANLLLFLFDYMFFGDTKKKVNLS